MVREEIFTILRSKSPSAHTMGLWERALEVLPDELLVYILDVLKISDGYRDLTAGLEHKAEILKSGNIKEWQRAINEDIRLLRRTK